MGSSYQQIAVQFLGYNVEEIEDMQESHRNNTSRVKFDILNGWLRMNPEGNPRHVRDRSLLMAGGGPGSKVGGHRKYFEC